MCRFGERIFCCLVFFLLCLPLLIKKLLKVSISFQLPWLIVLPFLRMNVMKVVFFYEILKNASKLSLIAAVQI